MGWELEKTLSEGGASDRFGEAVGIHGNYAIVGGDGGTGEQGIVNIYQMKY